MSLINIDQQRCKTQTAAAGLDGVSVNRDYVQRGCVSISCEAFKVHSGTHSEPFQGQMER